jgi:uncharacterized protein (TIGR03032 family)
MSVRSRPTTLKLGTNAEKGFGFEASPGLPDWLESQKSSLLFSTYEVGKVFLVEQGEPRFATCVSQTNVSEGWREHRRDGGVVLDVQSGEAVATGLSMPHAPRLYDGALWMIQSGTGELGWIDLDTGQFEPVCFLPGFARGLSIFQDRAVIGVSLPRGKTKVFEGLELEERLTRERVEHAA